jgi:ABC-2 type transport system ATP-binding protein
VTLLFGEEALPDDLSEYGTVLQRAAPKATLQIERLQVARTLAAILDRHTILDVSVEDPPLEDVIADMFSQARDQDEHPQKQEMVSG